MFDVSWCFNAIFVVFVGLSVLQVFLRAMDLGFTRCAQPKRPGVAETLDAAEALLRTSGKAAARVLGAAMEAQPEMLGIWNDKRRTMEAEIWWRWDNKMIWDDF